MAHQFRDWLGCPECDERDEISMMAHNTDIALECYTCGVTSEYIVGDDIPIHGLDIDAIGDVATDFTTD